MRKIYMYNIAEGKSPVAEFIKKSDTKVRKKLDFILRVISDENNQMKEPYVKHFSIEKYKMLYELRLKASGAMIRIIFYYIEDNIVLLHAFVKKDRRDTEQALEFALRLMEKFDINSVPIEQISEVELN